MINVSSYQVQLVESVTKPKPVWRPTHLRRWMYLLSGAMGFVAPSSMKYDLMSLIAVCPAGGDHDDHE